MSKSIKPTTRIAVIGIGSAGLGQLKQTRDAFDRREVRERTHLELVGIETRREVGGLWNYVSDPKPFIKKHRPDGQTYVYPEHGENPTPFYEDLRATLSGDLMAFGELPFTKQAPEIPWGHQIQEYLVSFTDTFDLRKYVGFDTRAERLYYTERYGGRKWTLETSGSDGKRVEEFDFVAVCNGHYSDPWIPFIPGLSAFKGKFQHSREYRRQTAYVGQRVLVLGSGNSGSDIVRHLALLNTDHYLPSSEPLPGQSTPPSIPCTTVYHSIAGANRGGYNVPTDPWTPYIRTVTLISHITPDSRIHLTDGTVLEDIDTIIFATGYNNSLPFAKVTDEPWKSCRVLDGVISLEEREKGGDESEIGGQKGLHITGLDELLLFLKDDRTLSFPGLPYQIVPFPFSEAQSRLSALLWADLLPSFPKHPIPPPNPAVSYPTPPPTPPADVHSTSTTPPGPVADGNGRISETVRKELIFAIPYEWTYTRFLMDLMREGETKDTPEYWRDIEEWRIARRKDTGFRKRSLGY